MKVVFPTSGKNDPVTIQDVAVLESSMMEYFHTLFLPIRSTGSSNTNSSSSNHGSSPQYTIPMTITTTTSASTSTSTSTSKKSKHEVDVLRFHVDVADSIFIGNIATVTAQVSVLYVTNTKQSASTTVVTSQTMVDALTYAVADRYNDNSNNDGMAQQTSLFFATFTSDPSIVTIAFNSNEDASSSSSSSSTTIVLRDNFDTRRRKHTSKEIALIVVTVLLSFVLFIVSSVLLHITGGWKVCTNVISNCLFEEVDDEDDNDDDDDDQFYNHPLKNNSGSSKQNIEQQRNPHSYEEDIPPNPTFPMQYSHDQNEPLQPVQQHVHNSQYHQRNNDDEEEEEDDTNFMDVESTMTSVLPTSASGLLGVARNQATTVTIHTMMGDDDDDDDDESNIYGDGITPVSRRSNMEALGITSMRKLPMNTSTSNTGTNADCTTPKLNGFSQGMIMMQRRFLLRSASKKTPVQQE
jgi:hypothetical protein